MTDTLQQIMTDTLQQICQELGEEYDFISRTVVKEFLEEVKGEYDL